MLGFQWVNGSFCEDLTHAKREPGDIDVVTFYEPPAGTDPDAFEDQLMTTHRGLSHPRLTKSQFLTDAYFVRLEKKRYADVQAVHYWFGLFSHRRVDNVWKGIVQVPLNSKDEAKARAVILASIAKHQPSGSGSAAVASGAESGAS